MGSIRKKLRGKYFALYVAAVYGKLLVCIFLWQDFSRMWHNACTILFFWVAVAWHLKERLRHVTQCTSAYFVSQLLFLMFSLTNLRGNLQRGRSELIPLRMPDIYHRVSPGQCQRKLKEWWNVTGVWLKSHPGRQVTYFLNHDTKAGINFFETWTFS